MCARLTIGVRHERGVKVIQIETWRSDVCFGVVESKDEAIDGSGCGCKGSNSSQCLDELHLEVAELFDGYRNECKTDWAAIIFLLMFLK